MFDTQNGPMCCTKGEDTGGSWVRYRETAKDNGHHSSVRAEALETVRDHRLVSYGILKGAMGDLWLFCDFFSTKDMRSSIINHRGLFRGPIPGHVRYQIDPWAGSSTEQGLPACHPGDRRLNREFKYHQGQATVNPQARLRSWGKDGIL